MKIVYFSQDLADPVLRRRIRMLSKGFSEITLLGFRRSLEPVSSVEGITPIDLGRTKSMQLVRRAGSVLSAALSLHRHRDAIADADVVMGRNLEMAALAALARKRYAPSASLVFECLDIHWTMMARGPVGYAVRHIEDLLLRHSDLLVVSAPEYIPHYFRATHKQLPRTCVIENKLLESEVGPQQSRPLPPGPPWRIGVFGQVRCRESLVMLSRLAESLPGQLQIVVRGDVASHIFPDFFDLIRATPDIEYGGPYDRQSDLPSLYSGVHFSWAVDFYGSSGNSAILLPNRIYEGGVYGAIPIADASVATGRWLSARNYGILIEDPIEENVRRLFLTFGAESYARERSALDRVSRSSFVCSDDECRAICATLAAPRPSGKVGSSEHLRVQTLNRNV